jgi:hypothetical protein
MGSREGRDQQRARLLHGRPVAFSPWSAGDLDEGGDVARDQSPVRPRARTRPHRFVTSRMVLPE